MKKTLVILVSVALLGLSTTVSANPPIYQNMRGFTCYNNVNEQDIIQAKEYGANTLRLMLMIHDLLSLEYYDICPSSQIEPAKLEKIKNIQTWCKQHGMTLILDVHEIPGLVRWSGWKDFRLWDKIVGHRYQQLLMDVWQQLATEFKDEPVNSVVYELFNEPEPKANDWARIPENQPKIWYQLQDRIITKIRLIDTTHYLIGSPAYGWRTTAIEGYQPSTTVVNDGKIAVTVHMYHPHDYTMQWDFFDNPTGVNPKAYPGYFNGHIWQEDYWDINKIKWAFKPVADFQKKYPQIPVVITEFSVMRNVPGASLWLHDVIQVMKELNVGWTYHAYKEPGYLKDKKGVYDNLWDLEIAPFDRLKEVKAGLNNY